jgi:hypothetical protein
MIEGEIPTIYLNCLMPSGSLLLYLIVSRVVDGDQVMAGLQVNNHDQGSKFWTSSQFEEPGPTHIYN